MVDSRSATPVGMPGGINFKSGDISGTAAKTADDRSSRGMEYFMPGIEERPESENFVDRSMELRASLNSLALLNFVSVFKNRTRKNLLFDDEEYTDKISESKMTNPIEPVKNKKKRTSKKDTSSTKEVKATKTTKKSVKKND